MKIRAQFRHFNFPYLYDGDTQKVAEAYGPKATPHLFIFDKQRKLRYQGAVDNNQRETLAKNPYARNAIDALLAGKPVASIIRRLWMFDEMDIEPKRKTRGAKEDRC